MGTSGITQGTLPCARTLFPSPKFLLPCHVTYHRLSGLGCRHRWVAIILPHQRCLNDGMKATGLSIKAQTEAAGRDVDICVYTEQDEGNGILKLDFSCRTQGRVESAWTGKHCFAFKSHHTLASWY